MKYLVLALPLLLIVACTPIVEDQYYNDVLSKDNYPLTTGASVTELENALLGFDCESLGYDYNAYWLPTLPIDDLGFYGYKGPGSYVSPVECTKPLSPSSSATVYRVYVDPNNGFVYQQYCNDELLEGMCPKDSEGNVISFDLGAEDKP